MSATTHVWRPSSSRRIVLDGFLPMPRGTVPTTPLPLSWPAKDPLDVLDYQFNIADALLGNEGDTIASITATVSPSAVGDLMLNSSAADGATAVFWFSGGQSGTIYTVQIAVVTTNGRTIGRSVLLPVLSLTGASPPATALLTNLGAIVSDQNGNPILIGS